MAYYSIDLNALAEMISEYDNLNKVLEEEAGITAMEMSELTSGAWIGEDASEVKFSFQANTSAILTAREKLILFNSELNKGLADFREAKQYANRFAEIFDESYSSCSADEITGKLLCDEESIDELIKHCQDISQLEVSMAESVVKAKEYLQGLNRSQTDIEDSINIFSKGVDELKKIGLYSFSLNHYKNLVIQADIDLNSNLSSVNDLMGYSLPTSIIYSAEHSFEADTLLLLASKDNLTAEQASLMDDLMPRILTNEADLLYIVENIGAGESGCWTNLQGEVMSEIYKTAINNDLGNVVSKMLYDMQITREEARSEEKHFMMFPYNKEKNIDVTFFDSVKMNYIIESLDPDEDGKAYYTAVILSNYYSENATNVSVSFSGEDGFNVISYNDNGKEIQNVFLKPIDMNDIVSNSSLEKIGFTHDDAIRFKSSIYTEADIEFVKNMANTDFGVKVQADSFFASNDILDLSHYPSTAMALYSQYLVEADVEAFENFNSALLNSECGKMDYNNKSVLGAPTYVDSRDKYMNLWIEGLNNEYSRAVVNTSLDDSVESYDQYTRVNTMLSLANSEVVIIDQLESFPSGGGLTEKCVIDNLNCSSGTITYDFKHTNYQGELSYTEKVTIETNVNKTENSRYEYSDAISTYRHKEEVAVYEAIRDGVKNGMVYFAPQYGYAFQCLDSSSEKTPGIPVSAINAGAIDKALPNDCQYSGSDIKNVISGINKIGMELINADYKYDSEINDVLTDEYVDYFGNRSVMTIESGFIPSMNGAGHSTVVLESELSPPGEWVKDYIEENGWTFYQYGFDNKVSFDLEEHKDDVYIKVCEIASDENIIYAEKLLYGGFDFDEYFDNHTAADFSELIESLDDATHDACSNIQFDKEPFTDGFYDMRDCTIGNLNLRDE